MIIRLRSKRLIFKSTCNRRHMHYNYSTTTNGDHHHDDDDDDRQYSTQLYPIQEITKGDRIMENMTILDHGVVVDDYDVQPPSYHRNMITSSMNGGDDGHHPYSDDNSDSDDNDSVDSYDDDLIYSESEHDDNKNIPSSQHELVVSMLEDMLGCVSCCHYNNNFQEARTPPPPPPQKQQHKNHVNAENVRNDGATIAVVYENRTIKNTCIAETTSKSLMSEHKSPYVDTKYETQPQQYTYDPNRQPTASIVPSATTAKKIPTCIDKEIKTDDSVPRPLRHHHHHHHSSSSISAGSTTTTTTTPDSYCRRRRNNHAMSQTDFCDVLRLLKASSFQ
jgi:hypothetical protein